jgi:hypothetical protein
MVKAEEKFARVTVACIGEAAVRRRQEAGGRISGTSRPHPEPDRSRSSP